MPKITDQKYVYDLNAKKTDQRYTHDFNCQKYGSKMAVNGLNR